MLAATVPFINTYVLTPERVRTTLVPILEARLGRSIEIDDAGVSWRGLALDGVSIAEDDSFARVGNASVLRADRVVLLLNPLALRNREIVIEQLYLDRPAITVARGADGSWNLASLARALTGQAGDPDRTAAPEPATAPGHAAGPAPPGASTPTVPESSGWHVRLKRTRIHDGSLTYFDSHEHLADRPLWARLDELELRALRGQQQGIIDVSLTGHLIGSFEPEPTEDQIELETALSASGPIDLNAGQATFAVGAESIDVDAIVALLRKDPDRPRRKKIPEEHASSLVRFDVTVPTLLYQGYRFEQVAGRIDLIDLAMVTGNIDADLAGGSVNVAAKFDFSGEGITVDGSARGVGVRSGPLLQRFHTAYLPKLGGTADVVLELFGHADRLGEAFQAAVPGRRPSTGGRLHAHAVFDVEEIDIDSAYIDIFSLLGPRPSSEESKNTERTAGSAEDTPAEQPRPINYEGLEIDCTIKAKKALFQGIPFTDLLFQETFTEGTSRAAATAEALLGAAASLSFDIEFDEADLPYTGQLQLWNVDVVAATEKYSDLRLGNSAGRMDVELDLAGSIYGVRSNILRTLLAMSAERSHKAVAHAQIKLNLERLDLETVVGPAKLVDPGATVEHDEAFDPDSVAHVEGSDPDDDFGALNTGALHIDLDLAIGETSMFGYVFQDVAGSVQLVDSVVQVAHLRGEVAGGTFDLSGNVELDYAGFLYDGTLDIVSADIPVLLAPFMRESFGKPVGVANAKAIFDGSGLSFPEALDALSAEMDIQIPQGRVRDSEMFRQIEKLTGIRGFHDFQVKNSRSHVIVAGGLVTMQNALLGGDDARIKGDGRITFDGGLDFDLELGFGPTSQRRLLAPGIVLPYSVDQDGWTNLPLMMDGRIGDPKIRVPVDAYAGTAVRAAPDAAGRLISEGARGGGRVLKSGANAVGTVLGGIGSVLGGEKQPDGSAPAREIDGVQGNEAAPSPQARPPDSEAPAPTSAREAR